MPGARAFWLAAWSGLSLSQALAQEAGDSPDMAFLEYLGSWQEDDEEWLIVSEWEPAETPPADGRPDTEADDDEEE